MNESASNRSASNSFLTPEEIHKIFSDTSYKDHCDKLLEAYNKNSKSLNTVNDFDEVDASAVYSASLSDPWYIIPQYQFTPDGAYYPDQGSYGSCQSFAACILLQNYLYKKFARAQNPTSLLHMMGQSWYSNYPDLRSSPYYIYNNLSGLLGGGGIWGIQDPLNFLVSLGCSPLRTYDYYSHFTPYAPWGVYSYNDLYGPFGLAVGRNISDAGWRWAPNANTGIAHMPTISNGQFIHRNDIKWALALDRPVIVRFFLQSTAVLGFKDPYLGAVSGNWDWTHLPILNQTCTFNGITTTFKGWKFENQNDFTLNGNGGPHDVAIIGWDDYRGSFICVNSWGFNQHGMNEKGNFYMTYATLEKRCDQAAWIRSY